MKRWSDGVGISAASYFSPGWWSWEGGAVVEIAELIGSTMSGVFVGDYANNALDLVANGVAAAVGVGVVWWFQARGRESTESAA
ncbi:MAG TPA: hypothetical protein VMP13_07150 [Acidimicrobiia bacterium]|nr:hypothetical protein [Acidimicrobiia bacterium]